MEKRPVSVFVAIGLIVLAGAAGYFVVERRAFSLGPGAAPPRASETGLGNIDGGVSAIGPKDAQKTGLAPYPDLPLASLPSGPQSVRYIIEHRSALNQKTIAVRGVVVGTAFQRYLPCTTGPCPMYAPASGIVLADIAGAARDKQYDLSIILLGDDTAENEKTYFIGKTVEMAIQVWGSKTAILANKSAQAP